MPIQYNTPIKIPESAIEANAKYIARCTNLAKSFWRADVSFGSDEVCVLVMYVKRAAKRTIRTNANKSSNLNRAMSAVQRCRLLVLVFHKETKPQNPNEISLQVSYVDVTGLEVFP